MTDTTTLTTVTMTPFAGHVRTLIWGSCAVARPSLMHIPKIVPGGDTACEPVVTCPCCGVEPCGANADCGMCRDDAAALGVAMCANQRMPWPVLRTYDWCTVTGTLRAGGSTLCSEGA